MHNFQRFIRNNAGGSGGVALYDNSFQHYVIDPDNAYCAIDFRTNGQVLVAADNTPSTELNWFSPTTSLIGNSYEISFDGGSSWLPLTTNRVLSVSRSFVGTTMTTFDVRIRDTATHTELEAASITLDATVDI